MMDDKMDQGLLDEVARIIDGAQERIEREVSDVEDVLEEIAADTARIHDSYSLLFRSRGGTDLLATLREPTEQAMAELFSFALSLHPTELLIVGPEGERSTVHREGIICGLAGNVNEMSLIAVALAAGPNLNVSPRSAARMFLQLVLLGHQLYPCDWLRTALLKGSVEIGHGE